MNRCMNVILCATLCGGACAGIARAQSSDTRTTAGAELRWQRAPSLGCVTSSTAFTLSSPDAVRAAGFEFAQVQSGPLTRTIERNAEVAYNANRYARLSSRAGGVIVDVMKDLGEPVKKGEALVIIDSTDLGAAKAEFLQAVETVNLWDANAKRERALLDKGAGIEREVLEAETKLAEARIALSKARQRLRSLGLREQHIDDVQKNNDTSSMLMVTASFDGLVVERSAVLGEVVEPSTPLVSIADTSVMWAMLDLIEADLAVVKTGQQASVTVDGLAGKSFGGRLTWISTQIDPKTRTLKARVELDNGEGLLRANMFGRARISAGESRVAITIPKEAVQWEGCCNIAFVRSDTDDKTFQPARLVLGFDTGDGYEVVDGLKPGDMIVTKGSFILKNEILKNSVGAGCCEVDHLKK
ncbi:MAG: efflux RND transporter periplasmic adaptor subunit [Phycisphaerales bacterium]|nr:efflux RND transporter periplasmic adaptor subunit [Phycisphaerales bacterium]MCI0674968.1 efflux RND transporter periplasmic adaptor subunit [Phycisphaerales bacterium]